MELSLSLFEGARNRIEDSISKTPLTFSPTLSARFGRSIFLKWENRHFTGAFKERGALNFLLKRMEEGGLPQGVIAASMGNHALGLSYHATRLGIPCTLVVPQGAPLVKVSRCEGFGARIILWGETLAEAYEHAQMISQRDGATFVPPYDHEDIVAGQGTCGLEIDLDLEHFDAVIVPCGGGGLLGGVAASLRLAGRNHIRIIGVESAWAASYRREGVALPQAGVSIADGIAVKSLGKVTAPIIERYVDEMIAVSEGEVATSIMRFLSDEHVVVEGGGAVGLVPLLRGDLSDALQRIVIVVSGSNIDLNLLARLIEREMGEQGRLLQFSVSVPDRPGSLARVAQHIADKRANILEALHSRSFSLIPGCVDISFTVEVRDRHHSESLLSSLRESGVVVSGR